MRKDIIDFIRELSQLDSKTLSQKALKVSEEAGELAKVVLPFENAAQTTHRFVDRQRILEEVADLYLTSMSIAHELDFSEEEIEEMIYRKALKWDELQKREEKTDGKDIPYEIHITVKNANKKEFIALCEELDVKPIILDLQRNDGKHSFEDVMTSSVHLGNNRSAYEEMKRISDGLKFSNFEVVREKIETVPWHPAAPTEEHLDPIMPPNCYFETHLGVVVCDEMDVEDVRNIAKAYDAHLSRNAFKVHADGSYTMMVTCRSYTDVFEDFDEHASELYDTLCKHFQVEKRITEFSIYDTKVSHDTQWLNNE